MAYDRSSTAELCLKTDGGSRGNPGIAGIGFSIFPLTSYEDGAKSSAEALDNELMYGAYYLGECTNNVAEYKALIWGLHNALSLEPKTLVVCADSELIVKQINGIYQVKDEKLKALHQEALRIIKRFASITIKHIYREENKRADELANLAMDEQGASGNYVFDLDGMPLNLKGRLRPSSNTQHSTSDQDSLFDVNSDASTSNTLPNRAISPIKGVFRLTIKSHFDAAHALLDYPGECRKLHGHTWDIECTIKGNKLDEVGILYDFKALKADLNKILDRFDHGFMNDVAPFDQINSTAENLSCYLFHELEGCLPEHIQLEEVVVWESPVAKTSYRLS